MSLPIAIVVYLHIFLPIISLKQQSKMRIRAIIFLAALALVGCSKEEDPKPITKKAPVEMLTNQICIDILNEVDGNNYVNGESSPGPDATFKLDGWNFVGNNEVEAFPNFDLDFNEVKCVQIPFSDDMRVEFKAESGESMLVWYGNTDAGHYVTMAVAALDGKTYGFIQYF